MLEETKVLVETQGAPEVNFAVVVKQSETIALVEVDMISKYCEVVGYESDENDLVAVLIGATENSTNLNVLKENDSWTTISFPEFKDWSIWCTEASRYTIKICFVKR